MKKVCLGLFLISALTGWAQPYPNYTCETAQQICSGQNYSYTAWTGENYAQPGPAYGCLTNQPDPAWFWFVIGEPGDIHIYMNSVSTPCRDIDFILWGPFTSPDQCTGGLVATKIRDCSYSNACTETADLASTISGEYYILLITNFSKLACTINFSQTGGSGTMVCLAAPVAGSNSPVCAGDTLKLTASTTYSGAVFHWSGPGSFTSTSQNPVVPNASVMHTGTYTVYISVGTVNGPPASLIATVNPIPLLQLNNNPQICLGDSVSLGAPPSFGYAYSWASSPPGFTSALSNPVVSPPATTTYSLTVTALGCYNNGSTTVTVKPLPNAYTGPDKTICSGMMVVIGGAPVGGSTYSWVSEPAGFTSSLSNPVVSPQVTTTYTLTQTASNGCQKTNSVTITVNPSPIAYTGPNQSICSGMQAQLGQAAVPGNTYSWTSVPPGFTSTLSNPLISPDITTTYTLTESVSTTGCNKQNSVTVTVNALPTANAGNSSSLCAGSSKVIGSGTSQNCAYSWTSNPAGFTSTLPTPAVSPQQTTVYKLTVTDTATSCTSTDSVTISVNPLPVLSIIPNASVCEGASVVLAGPPVSGNTYLWNSNPMGFSSTLANPTVNPVLSTIYTLTQKITLTGCTKSASTIITVKPLPNVTLPSFPPVCKDASPILLNSGSPSGGTYGGPGVSGAYFNPQAVGPGTYAISYSYTSSQGCTKTVSQNMTVNAQPKITGTVTYDNVANSGVDSVRIRLLTTSSVPVDSAFTATGGTYTLKCLPQGIFKLKPKSFKKWGGVNATDALMVAQHSVGLITLSAFRQLAGDVNLSGTVNSGDAFLIMKRFTGLSSSFPSGDWCIPGYDSITLATTDLVKNFQALCHGDVNGSWSGSKNGTSLTIRSISAGAREAAPAQPDGSLLLPLMAGDDISVSAISLCLKPEDPLLRITGVSGPPGTIVYNIDGDVLRIAWYSLKPIFIRQYETVFTLSIRPISGDAVKDALSLVPLDEAEFADQQGKAIPSLSLFVPSLSPEPGPEKSVPFPFPNNPSLRVTTNPVNELTMIRLDLDRQSSLTIRLLTTTGKELAHQDYGQVTGIFERMPFDVHGLAAGMYFLMAEIKNENYSGILVKKIIR